MSVRAAAATMFCAATNESVLPRHYALKRRARNFARRHRGCVKPRLGRVVLGAAGISHPSSPYPLIRRVARAASSWFLSPVSDHRITLLAAPLRFAPIDFMIGLCDSGCAVRRREARCAGYAPPCPGAWGGR
jgi:hypothetical protein